jgi:hypothetical protein
MLCLFFIFFAAARVKRPLTLTLLFPRNLTSVLHSLPVFSFLLAGCLDPQVGRSVKPMLVVFVDIGIVGFFTDLIISSYLNRRIVILLET